jgi:major membrane immunogen (membrane-anchored lipoprotein)
VNGVRPVYHDVDGRLRGSYYIDDRPEYVWKESLRVEFKNGRVTAVEGVE